jgi:hypothetical protein
LHIAKIDSRFAHRWVLDFSFDPKAGGILGGKRKKFKNIQDDKEFEPNAHRSSCLGAAPGQRNAETDLHSDGPFNLQNAIIAEIELPGRRSVADAFSRIAAYAHQRFEHGPRSG